MTKFTTKNLPTGSDSIITFLRARPYLKTEDRLIGNNLHAVYSRGKSIKALEQHIEKHSTNHRFKKHFGMWKRNLNILKGL